jgi:lipoyl(octanoyl) transferase
LVSGIDKTVGTTKTGAPELGGFPVAVRQPGLVDYADTLAAMSTFTDQRGPETPDEIWFLEHAPVFTLGLNADRSHLLAPGDIEVIQVDRGGQVTYHGPGQLIAYVLLDLKRANIGVRALISALEQTMIEAVAALGVTAISRSDAPGIYVEGAKLGSVGLRVRRGCSYHGFALNIDMDLQPFDRIDTCGFAGLPVTQISDLTGPVDRKEFDADIELILIDRIRSAAG